MSDAARRYAAASLLLDKGNLRMPIHGRSMAPSIVDPMVLQIGSARRVRIGDVIVFRRDDVRVAHRVIAFDRHGCTTSGDAQPHVMEYVSHGSVLGRVVAIWSDASAGARQQTRWAVYARAWYFGRGHRIHRAVRLAREKAADLFCRAWPGRRPRFTGPLVDALRAAQADDPAGLTAALNLYARASLPGVDSRHRCGAVLGEAARRLAIVSALPEPVAAHLRAARLNAMVGSTRMYRATAKTAAVLERAGIAFALLKGAARMYNGNSESAYHPSDDIDILVRSRDVDAAVASFEAAGWQPRETLEEIQRFRREHHHAASLFPPDGGFPVEIHRALAIPGSLSTATDWDALSGFLVPVADGPGNALQLDRVGTALHLAIHAIGLTRMRDIALLARLLPTLNAEDLSTLRGLVERERLDGIRLGASLELAAFIAGVAWPSEPRITRYARWALRREDLPLLLRSRTDAAEVFFARGNAPWPAFVALVPWWSRGREWFAAPGRIAGRCAATVSAILYAALLPASGPERFS